MAAGSHESPARFALRPFGSFFVSLEGGRRGQGAEDCTTKNMAPDTASLEDEIHCPGSFGSGVEPNQKGDRTRARSLQEPHLNESG